MRLPDSANDIEARVLKSQNTKAYVENPYFDKQMLTEEEALDAISLMSARLLIERTNE